MTRIEDIRLGLVDKGYEPLPLNGKIPVLDKWQKRNGTSPGDIEIWSKLYPYAGNTGILTKVTPTLDIDVLDPDAAAAVEALARERFEERGYVLPRFGNAPKRAIPFRTNDPFRKVKIELIAPDGSVGQKLEMLGDGQQVVVHGIHPDTHKPYAWFGGEPWQLAHDDLPYISVEEAQALVKDAADLVCRDFGYRLPEKPKAAKHGGQGNGGAADWGQYLENLADHDTLAAFGMALLRSGMSDGAAVNFLRGQVGGLVNIDPDRKARRLKEIPGMVASAREKLDAEAAPQPPTATPTTLACTVAVFEKWLLLKDPWPVYVTLGAIAANHLPGPPVWLGLIAPPSSAKTEILNAMLRLPKVELVTTASPAALLSGTPKKQTAQDAKGGLLRKVGSFGILVLKDFTSVLGLQRDNLSGMLDALREIFDGRWVRHLGTDGGKTLRWEGKLGLIFGCTEAYDSHYAIIGVLGDRFLLYRLPPSQHDQFEMGHAAYRGALQADAGRTRRRGGRAVRRTS